MVQLAGIAAGVVELGVSGEAAGELDGDHGDGSSWVVLVGTAVDSQGHRRGGQGPVRRASAWSPRRRS